MPLRMEVGRLFRRWMITVSPQFTMMVGPGIEPFIVRVHRSRPSGARLACMRSNQNSRITPVFGVVFV